ncbi:MAG: nitroreductase family protein [Spirochaetales bacterium]|nr:nitroreductase family protein [Spirochaetales bacterium]
MSVKDLIIKNRSYRRFDESKTIPVKIMRNLVELARFSATGSNHQPLKFMILCDPEKNNKIFPHLVWAASLKNWDGPAAGERPAGYIIILGDTTLAKDFGVNHGIAAQSILMGAVEQGLGGCMIASIKRDKLRETLAIPVQYDILLVVALGTPIEKVVLEDAEPGGKVTYYRDADDVHHVPKRTLDELIVCF